MPYMPQTFLRFQSPFFIDDNGVIIDNRLETLQNHPLDPPVLIQRRRFLEYAGIESFCRFARVSKPHNFPPIYFMESKE